MKNRHQMSPRAALKEKPRKAHIPGAEFRRRLKKIAEWRKQRLAELRAMNSR